MVSGQYIIFFIYKLALHLFFYDLWVYFAHIQLHKNMYVIHRVHHINKYAYLQYFHSHYAHIYDNTIQCVGVFIPLLVIRLHILNLIAVLCVINIRGLMKHDHRFSRLLGNHHLLHHKYPNYNFGEYWIDNMFGTLCPKKDEYIYGLLHT